MRKGTYITSRARWIAAGFAMVVASTAFYIPTAAAHGEKAQAAFLRMRTIHWYDLKWSDDTIAVNEPFTLSGRFYVFEEWPEAVKLPDISYLNIGQPGPVMFRTGIFLNDRFVPRSVGLELGGHYKFRVEQVGRRPGTWHVHALMNVQGGGPLVGPGKYVTITGDLADFEYNVTTLTGKTVDTERFGTGTVVGWHLFWYILGIAWMWWFVRRPIFLPRYMRVEDGEGDDLITPQDKKAAYIALVGTIVIVTYGFTSAEEEYPITIPLQSGLLADIAPLPVDYDSMVSVDVLSASYRVPGRSLQFTIEVTNHTDKVVSIGEFMTGGVRFLNADVRVDESDYPDNILAPEGLEASQQDIAPGETAVIDVTGTDAAWEVERLAGLANDVDMRFGGLLFFIDDAGNEIPIAIGAPMIPVFV